MSQAPNEVANNEEYNSLNREPVGLVGLGLVGTALAAVLKDAGLTVHGYDVVPEKRHEFASTGGTPQGSAAEVGAICATVLISVLKSDQAEEAIFGPAGLLQPGCATTLIIDTTTGDPESTVAVEARLHERGIRYVDATISGSSAQIREREAVYFAGGRPDSCAAARPLLDLLCKQHHYIGGPGSGARAKLVNNLILGLNRLALAEGLVFAERLGLDPTKMLEVLRTTPSYSAAMDVKGEKMVSGDFTPQARLSQHRKDLDIILDNAGRLGQPLPLTQLHRDLLLDAERNGLGDLDNSVVISHIRELGEHGQG